MTQKEIMLLIKAISRIEWMVIWKDIDAGIFEDIEYIYNQLEKELWLEDKKDK